MSRTTTLGAIATAVLVAACQAAATASPPVGSPSTTTPAATPAAPTDVASARLHGPLAGTYTTQTFTPAVTFTVPAGWIARSENTDSTTLTFGSDQLHSVWFARVVDGDPLAIARLNPIYTVGQPIAITVGGLPATETSVLLSIDAIQKSFYPLAKLADGGEGTLDLAKRGTQARVITVEVKGTVLVILVQRPADETGPFDAAAQALIDSITLG